MNEQLNIANFDILGVKISSLDMEKACSMIDRFIKEKKKSYICVCPVSTIMECQKDETYRDIVNSAALVTPDGMPTVWIGRSKGCSELKRVYGPDLMLAVCRLSEKRGYRHYFYGATDDVLKNLERQLKEKFPSLEICGSFAPPFRKLSKEEDTQVVEQIKRAKPDILWVGLGAPKQDYWMHEHLDKLDDSVMIGVGAAFDFLSGTKKQAPRWMQRAGLEWFFRLCCEPKRLWKRYLVGNTYFLVLLIKDFFKGKRNVAF